MIRIIEDKQHINWRSFILWPSVILVLYFLSSGPVLMLMEKRRIAPSHLFDIFFTPLDWAYTETPLRKPIGMYLHLWTEAYDKNGEIRIDRLN
jgi:hypothetical protein